ncbi:MAG: hypothetical protein ACTSQP_17390 [Promethearchaeota archaeon]
MSKNKFNAVIESTMVGPLWIRAEYGKKYPEIFYDPEAENIIKRLWNIFPEDHEGFKIMKEFIDEFAALNFLYRAKYFNNLIQKFTQKNPDGIIINLGCSLDTLNLQYKELNIKMV